MAHEVLTLQLGHYANYVGAHFWNLQDELLGHSADPDWADYASVVEPAALYSITEDKQGNPVYLPRTAIFDLSGSLGGVSFSRDATHYPDASSQSSWGGAVEVHRSAAVTKSPFTQRLEEQEHAWEGDEYESPAYLAQQAAALEAAARELDTEAGVRSWTDYLKATLDPRSVYTLPGLWSGVSEFEGYGDGVVAAANTESRDALMERVRVLAEGCDSLQGIQVFGEDLTGWGGLSAELLTEVREEYSNRPLLYFAVRKPQVHPPPGQGALQRTRLHANQAMSTVHLHEVTSLLVPLAVPWEPAALPHLRYIYFTPFHTSAILASAIDNITLPFRLTPHRSALGESVGSSNLHSMVQLLTARGGTHLAAARMQMPCPSLSSDLQQQQAGLDIRMHPAHMGGNSNGVGSSSGHGSDTGQGGGGRTAGTVAVLSGVKLMANFTPGIQDEAAACLAESITLRGARCSGAPASTTSSLQALDMLLLRNPRRAVQHRCVAPLPLLLPLPFPRIFSNLVSVHGDVHNSPAEATAAAAAHAQRLGLGQTAASAVASASLESSAAPQQEVLSVPVLTKLVATAGFRPWLQGLVKQWQQVGNSVAGRPLLESWDVSGADADEVSERLTDLAHMYSHGTDSDTSDDD